MNHGEREVPDRLPGNREDPECAEASTAILRYMEGRLATEAVDRLRRHLSRCETCNTEYRHLLLVRARIARSSMAKEPASPSVVESELAARNERIVSYSRRERGWRLRLLLLPAAVILLLVGVSRVRNHWPTVPIACIQGVTITPGGPMEAGSRSRHMRRGDWCRTEADSKARIEFVGATAELGPNTRVLVELPAEGRMRLQWGELELDGATGVATELGVLDVITGKARVHLTRDELSVECRTGSLTWLDQEGESVLVAGDVLRVSRTSPPVW